MSTNAPWRPRAAQMLLPAEVLALVCEYADARTHLAVGRVCRAWAPLRGHPPAWLHRLRADFPANNLPTSEHTHRVRYQFLYGERRRASAAAAGSDRRTPGRTLTPPPVLGPLPVSPPPPLPTRSEGDGLRGMRPDHARALQRRQRELEQAERLLAEANRTRQHADNAERDLVRQWHRTREFESRLRAALHTQLNFGGSCGPNSRQQRFCLHHALSYDVTDLLEHEERYMVECKECGVTALVGLTDDERAEAPAPAGNEHRRASALPPAPVPLAPASTRPKPATVAPGVRRLGSRLPQLACPL